jgi:hypothetical protein
MCVCTQANPHRQNSIAAPLPPPLPHLLIKRLQDDRDGKGIAQEQSRVLAGCVMAARQQAQPCSHQVPWDWGRQGSRLLEGAG